MNVFRAICLGLFCWGMSSAIIPHMVLQSIFMGLGAFAFMLIWVVFWYGVMEKLDD